MQLATHPLVSIPNRERDLLRPCHTSKKQVPVRVSIPNRERDLLRLWGRDDLSGGRVRAVSIPNRERDLLRPSNFAARCCSPVSIPNRERDLLRLGGAQQGVDRGGVFQSLIGSVIY